MNIETPSREDFAALLDETFGSETQQEGSVIKGTVIAFEKDLAVIDVGLKVEGRVPVREFGHQDKTAMRLKSIWSASKTRSVKPFCPAKKHAAKKAGSASKFPSKKARRLPVRFSIPSRVALRSILKVQLPFFRAARSTFVLSAM